MSLDISDELGELPEFDSDDWLHDLDELVADFIEDVVGGDYE